MQYPVGLQLSDVIVPSQTAPAHGRILDPGGGSEVRLSIGAITTTVASAGRELTLTVPPAVARFVVSGGSPDIRVEAAWRGDPPAAAGRLLFDSGGLWQLHEAGRQVAWTFRSPSFGSEPYKTALFDRDFSSGSVYLHAPYFDQRVAVYPLEYPLDELLLTNWLALGRGVEIHACAVRDRDGSGYLFAGHSGAGKTTMATLWQHAAGATILSDDRIILREADGQIWMHGTPWHGDEPLASPACTPLTRGFFLGHAAHNRTTGVRPPQAVAALFARAFPPFYSPPGLAFTLSFLEEVSRLAPFAELGFVPAAGTIDFVRSCI